MDNTEAMAKLAKYVLKKNEFNAQRQRARSKVRYYDKLIKPTGSTPIPQVAAAKARLKVRRKENLVLQLQAEIAMRKLSSSFKEELKAVRKILDSTILYGCGDSKIWGIVVNKKTDKRIMRLNELEQIILDYEAERILLKGEYA